MDGVKSGCRSYRAICLLRVAFLSGGFSSSLPGAEVLVQSLAPSDARFLSARQELQQLDGASTTALVFQGRNQTLRYTPPIDWAAAISSQRVVFTKAHATAILSVCSIRGSQSTPTPEQLQQFAQETAAILHGEGTLSPPTLLPFGLGRLIFAESTAASSATGDARYLQRVRSWGPDWQIEIEITGPEQEFRFASGFLSSIGNMQIVGAADEQAESAAREKVALAATSPPPRPRSSATETAPKTRGRLP